jgi:hypothetical protein
VSTINLEADLEEQAAALDERKWTALQTEITMNVANAKWWAFVGECDRAAEFVRLGLITRATAADYLHSAATYNALFYEYGADRVQAAMAAALESRAA